MVPRTSMIVARLFRRGHNGNGQTAEGAADNAKREP
jgi:hypothetical protein